METVEGISRGVNPGSSSASSLPRSFSYGTDDSSDALEAGRSPNSSLLGSRMNSRESLLGSRRGSVFGSRYGFGNAYFEVDDLGVYLSSLAVTVLMAAMATIGIILFTLVVTLAVMLGKCQKKDVPNTCKSFALNAELNNLQGWLLPQECEVYVEQYVNSGQYYSDFEVAINAARQYLNTIPADQDGSNLLVLDIDETCLSNMPYYVAHNYGSTAWVEEEWNAWVFNASAPALEPMLSLVTDLQAQNWSIAFITGRADDQLNITAQNLHAAGYKGWSALILRSPEEKDLTAVEYKTRNRKKLEAQGYHIRSAMGDQWSDIQGGHAGSRTFKLPNPMYYLY